MCDFGTAVSDGKTAEDSLRHYTWPSANERGQMTPAWIDIEWPIIDLYYLHKLHCVFKIVFFYAGNLVYK